MKIREAITHCRERLAQAGAPDPEQDARLLLSFVTGFSPMETLLNGGRTLSQEQERRLASLLLSRMQRNPLQYVLGEQWFYGLRFAVDSRVLVPRQETETLCEIGLAFVSALPSPRVLDLCTGSGAIAVVMKRALPGASVVAADCSADALAVARQNAQSNQADVRFVRGDLFAPLEGERFELILSNPPYVESAQCDRLQPEVRREPRLALDGGADGLDFYRCIAREAVSFLAPGGMLALEVGDGQAQAVAALFGAGYQPPQTHADLYGHSRVVSVRAAATPT